MLAHCWVCLVILAGEPTPVGGKFLTPRRRQSRHRVHLVSGVERGLWLAVLLEGHLAPCNAPMTVRARTHAVASHDLRTRQRRRRPGIQQSKHEG
jgi:hypothetical protein